MGFDNECILNIQSLAGEYFCPVCRTLVYPNEALQTQCTHLYCKPCLTYVVSSTQACPYDGYLVTEAGSKPLIETNKALAETIGRTLVHCLYHRSGCMWQGPLSECTTHCSGCAFGNSPVVCNRCGIQIVHRQVQEHAQSCNVNGTSTQPQQVSENAQDAAATSGAPVSIDQNKISNQAGAPASQPQASQTATGPSTTQNLNQPATANPLPQSLPATAVPTPEQWYQQQYQQYYQQYPGYDSYQQTYQQYYPYQQQVPQQFQQPPLQVQGQAQSQVQAQLQPQSQPQLQQQLQTPANAQIQPQVQPHHHPQPQAHAQVQSHPPTQAQGQPQHQSHSQVQPQIPSNGQPQPHLYPQAAVAGSSQNQAQVNPQQQAHPAVQPNAQIQSNQPLAHGHMPLQSYSQVQPHPVPSHAQQHMQVPQYQQPPPQQMHHSQPPQGHPHPQSQPQPHPQGHSQFQSHSQPQPQPQPPQPPNPQHPPPVQSVAGHHTYPSQPHQQIQQAPPQQHPMQVQPSTGSLPPGQGPAQFAQPPPHMRPIQPPYMLSSQGQVPGIPPAQQHIHPHNQPGLPVHQRPVMHQTQQPMPPQYVQQPQAFAGQASGPLPGQPHHAGPLAQQQHSQVRPQGPPQPMQQPPLGYVQPQQGTALPHGMQPQPHSSQSYVGRPTVLNQGGQSQQFPQSSGAAGVAPHARPPQFGSNQPSVTQSNVNMTNQQPAQYTLPVSGAVVERKGDHMFERRVEQLEVKSPSLKKSESEANDVGANFNEVKPETGMNDERKPGSGGEDNHRQDEAVTKDAVSELQQVQGVSGDPVTMQRVKEEGKESALDRSPGGKSVHNKAEDVGDVTVDAVKQGEANVSFHGSDTDKGSLAVPPGNSQGSLSGRDHIQQGHHDRTFSQSQIMSQGQNNDASGGSLSKGFESHPAPLSDQGRFQHPPVPYAHSGPQQRPAAPSLLQSVPPTGQVPGQPPAHLRPPGHGYLPHQGQSSNPADRFQPPGPNQPGLLHPEYPLGGPSAPGSTSMLAGGPNNFANHTRSFEPHSAGPQGQYNQGHIPPPHSGLSRMSQGEPLGPPLGSGPLPRGLESQTGPHHPVPLEADTYQNQRPPHFDSRRPDSYVPGNLERGPYGQPFGVESNSMRMNGAPPPGLDSSSAPVFGDEKFRTPPGAHPDPFPMGPTRRFDQSEYKEPLKQFPRPPHLGNEASPKFGNNSSRPISGYGMDGPSRSFDKEPYGYGYDAGPRMDPGTGGPPSGFLPSYHSAGALHPNESGGRPLPVGMHDDNRGRLDNNPLNPDFLGPMHGFGRHHMHRLPPSSPGNPSRSFGAPHNIDVDGREMERHPFGERFPILPPDHMHRGELDGPGNMRSGDLSQTRRGQPFGLRNLSGRPHVGEPGFGSFQDYGRSGESNGPGGFSHHQPFGESFGTKSTHPHLGEPGFRSSYSRQGFPNDGGFYAGGPDSFDQLRKRKTLSMGWCRICKVDCESVEGLDMHGQTREHQRMAMDMVNSIKQKAAKKQKTSNDHSVRDEASKLRNAEIHGRVNKP